MLLEKHGYTGSFIAGDAERTLPPDALQSQRPQPIEERGELPVNTPWPSFTPRPVPHLTYPPVLYAEHTSQATMPFFLSPPMPTHLPLVRLLQAYCSFNGSYSDFISLVFLWIRSIDLPQLSPTCIALMVIGYLQVRETYFLSYRSSDQVYFVTKRSNSQSPVCRTLRTLMKSRSLQKWIRAFGSELSGVRVILPKHFGLKQRL